MAIYLSTHQLLTLHNLPANKFMCDDHIITADSGYNSIPRCGQVVVMHRPMIIS